MGARGIAEELGIAPEEARQYIAAFYRQFPSVEAWTARCVAEVRRARLRPDLERRVFRRIALPIAPF